MRRFFTILLLAIVTHHASVAQSARIVATSAQSRNHEKATTKKTTPLH